MRPDPFAALGLPADPGLSDDQVRTAWRKIAAATHPDRADGGDVPRYTAAASAYAQLPTTPGYAPAPAAQLPAAPGIGLWHAVLLVPARIRHGRPVRLLIRAIVAAVLCLVVLHLVPGQPSGPAVVTGLITWFVLTARGDLAPPP